MAKRNHLAPPTFLIAAVLAGTPGRGAATQAAPGLVGPAGTPDRQIAGGTTLAFAVATVRANRSDRPPELNFTLGPGDAYAATGGLFRARGISLLDYVRFAYKLTDGQAEILRASAPVWIETERFDIQARAETPNPTKDQMRLMMQSLLTERFELQVHTETRQLAVLALVLAKPGRLGAQLRPHSAQDGECTTVAPRSEQGPLSKAAGDLPNVCGSLTGVGVPGAPGRVRLGGRNVPLPLLAGYLGQMGQYDRPVVDQTGLRGQFDVALEWGPDGDSRDPSASALDRSQAYLQEALEDQLGLKLERRRAPIPVLLIDHIDQQPTEN